MLSHLTVLEWKLTGRPCAVCTMTQAWIGRLLCTSIIISSSYSSNWDITYQVDSYAQKLIKKKPWIVYFVGVLLKDNNGCPLVAWTANILQIQLSHHWLYTITKSSISFLLCALCVRTIYCVVCVQFTVLCVCVCLSERRGQEYQHGMFFGVVAVWSTITRLLLWWPTPLLKLLAVRPRKILHSCNSLIDDWHTIFL